MLCCVALMLLHTCGDGTKQATGTLNPEGGELCLESRKVCVIAPAGALAEPVTFRIALTQDKPSAALGEAFDISASPPIAGQIRAPLTVEFSSTAALAAGQLPDDSLLRVFARHDKTWEALEKPRIDRVRSAVFGETRRFSPFVLLRADRTPDGKIPEEFDGGQMGTDPIIDIPPRRDGGVPAFDAGVVKPDAGVPPKPDAGRPDAGRPDAGRPDAGPFDAGPPDAGPADSGQAVDAGDADAGEEDAGP
jgi:hypothetical protein